ncbi:hypothetical protein BDV12DRAFT_191071 [Aspergillus spectabilis]
MPSRSCGTYRDRHILCDRTLPHCEQCSQTNRPANNSKCALLAQLSSQSRNSIRQYEGIRLVNISTWDIKLHDMFKTGSARLRRLDFTSLVLYQRTIYSLREVTATHDFQDIASAALTTFSHQPSDLGDLLMRMTLANDSPSATAAANYKIAAIKALLAASEDHISTIEAVQYVAARMLFCSFEMRQPILILYSIHQASCTPGQWTNYVAGVKSVINSSALSMVYYHDVLARFNMVHWHQQEVEGIKPSLWDTRLKVRTQQPAIALITLLSNLSDVMSARQSHKSPEDATLIYLYRASNSTLPGLSIVTDLPGPFHNSAPIRSNLPHFILGCEAGTDTQRSIVLNLFEQTEKSTSSRSLFLVKKIIQAIWVQNDLAESGILYMGRLSAIVSCCPILPTFV